MQKTFNADDNYKVRDHCNFTGKYKGAAHNVCSLNSKSLKKIPIVFYIRSTSDFIVLLKNLQENLKDNLNA